MKLNWTKIRIYFVTLLAITTALLAFYVYISDNGKLDEIINILRSDDTKENNPKVEQADSESQKKQVINKIDSSSKKEKKEEPEEIVVYKTLEQDSGSKDDNNVTNTDESNLKVLHEETKNSLGAEKKYDGSHVVALDNNQKKPNSNKDNDSHVIKLGNHNNYGTTTGSKYVPIPNTVSKYQDSLNSIGVEFTLREMGIEDFYTTNLKSKNETGEFGSIKFVAYGKDFFPATLKNLKTKRIKRFDIDFRKGDSPTSITYFGIKEGRYLLSYQKYPMEFTKKRIRIKSNDVLVFKLD
ncbi:hypothetical protein [uncultured Lacinutrix sp.]|uniref:hypothetical protein n=1 Tax=uncultured Lacinutrix sp. TaxID=574032 RepID=UPI0026020C64|nr:hypothetical protein [uncultured Lacinutrix sp.]